MSEETRRSSRRAPPRGETAPATKEEEEEQKEAPSKQQQQPKNPPPRQPPQEEAAASQAASRPPAAAAAAAAPGGAPPEGERERWRGREGMYPEYPPAMYPPPEGGAYPPQGMPPPYPPGGPQQWPHPYGPPMGNYPMYPPHFQHGPYPPQGFPPGYYPGDPMLAQRYPGELPPGGVPPYAEGRAARGRDKGGEEGGGDYYEEEEDSKRAADTSSASRVRLYVKSKIPTRQEVLDRRARKNAQSRARAAKMRQRIADLETKPDEAKTEEEQELFEAFQNRRGRKNDRSRMRAIEKKNEIERILNKPDKKRTQIERDFLRTALTAKQRKNEGDRLRRQRIKQMRKSGYGSGMADIPMSPLPPSVPRHLGSPGTYPSPGLMAYHSPRRPPGHPGQYMPPGPPYDPQASPATRTQLHLPQQSSSVAQHRHPDGSMTINIGGGAGGPGYSGEQARLSPPNESSLEMSQLLFDNSEEGAGSGAAAGDDAERKADV